jgi:hypothetical protein
MLKTFLIILLASLGFAPQPLVNQPTELGAVKWNTDLEKAKAISARTGKPLFVQFQEVPG